MSAFLIFQNITSDNCDIQADVDHFYVKTKAVRSFVVPDESPGVEVKNVGSCDFNIIDDYRMPSEDAIFSQIDFSVRKYAKMTVSITGEGYVTYSLPTISGRVKCDKGTSPCTEYFDVIDGQIDLWALNNDGTLATSATWSGTGMSSGSCIGETANCDVNLDFMNKNPPNVQVLFGSDGIYSVDMSFGKYVHGTQQISCFSYLPSGCNVDYSLQEKTNTDNVEGYILVKTQCGTPKSLRSIEICRINGKFQTISMQDDFTVPYVGYGTGTNQCTITLNFDGSQFRYQLIDTRKTVAIWLEGTVSSTYINTFNTTFDVQTPLTYRKEVKSDYSSSIDPGGMYGETAIDYIVGDTDSSKFNGLKYVRPVDAVYCKNLSVTRRLY